MKFNFAQRNSFGKMTKHTGKRGSSKRSRKKGSPITGSTILVMFYKLAILLGLFSISRVVFYLFNHSLFSGISGLTICKIFILGLRFDLSAILFLNIPFILINIIPFTFRDHKFVQRIGNIYFYLINSLALATNFIDLVYFRFTLKRMTSDIFTYLGVGGDFNVLVPQFIKDFWYILVIWIILSVVLIWLGSRITVKPAVTKPTGRFFRYYIFQTILFLGIGFLTVIGIRGGFQLRPIGVMTAGNQIPGALIPLVINTPFSIIRSFGHETVQSVNYYKTDASLEKIYNPVHPGSTKGFNPYNVLIIIMESFSREHSGFLNREFDQGRYAGYTPVLDSLIREGSYFEGFANGKTSIQGVPAILSAIPSLMNESITLSRYSGNRLTSIAGLLRRKGYSTAFFHGGTNGSMGFDAYTRVVGFDHYFGRTEYNNEQDYDGKWGIMDDKFFQFAATQLNELKQPFVGAFFSLSSHHPYYVPEKYQHLFRQGPLPIHQSIVYADFSLGKFLQTIKRSQWYSNTIIVITADHTSEGYYPYYQGSVGQYAIPILFLLPGQVKRGIYDQIGQQTDILPTLLSFMGYEHSYIAFGSDLFNPSAPHFSIHYLNGIYGMVKDGYYLEFDGNSSISLYDLKQDPLQKQNLIHQKHEVRAELERFIQAVIQQYNNRVIENRLTLPL